jgi:hypothetical protein
MPDKTVSTAALSVDIGLATMEAISSNTNTPLVNSNDVKFTVAYAKDYKGEKLIPEGEIITSKESAEHFESVGIGYIGEKPKEKLKDVK